MPLSSTMALALVLSAKTNAASKAIDKFTSKTANKLAKMAQKSEEMMRKGFVDFEVGKAIIRPVTALTEAAVSFQDKMADVAKFTNDKIGSEGFKKLSRQALEVSKKMGIPAEEAADSFAQLAASGTAIDKLKEMAIKAAVMGKAFDISAGQAADGYKAIQAALGATDSRMDRLMNTTNALTNAYGKGADAASQLFTFMQTGGASMARALHTDGRFVAAMGNTMRNLGIDTAVAATAMKRFGKDIIRNKEAARIFNKAGGGQKGIMAILETAKASGNAIKWFTEHKIAGEYASQIGLLASTMGDKKGLKNQLKVAMGNNTGSVSAEAANRMSTDAEKIKRFNAALQAMKISAGNTLLPALTNLMKVLSPLIDKLGTFLKENPNITKTFLSMALAIGGLKVAGGVGRILAGSFIRPLSKAVGFFAKGKDGVSKFNKVVSATKKVSGVTASATKKAFGVVSKAVGDATFKARFYSEYYGRKAFKGISKAATKSASGIGKAFSVSGKFMKSGLLKAFKGVGKAFSVVGKFMMANPWILIVMAIAAAAYLIIKNWDKVKAFFIKLWGWIKKIFLAAWQWIKRMFLNYTPYGLIIKHWDKISAFFVGLWDKVKGYFVSAWQWIKKMYLKYTIVGNIITHWSKISTFFSGLWEGIKNSFKSAIDWIVNKFNWVNNHILKPIGKFLGFGGDSNVNIKNGNKPLPQPNPVNNNSVNAPFTMNFALSGTATQQDADMIVNTVKKHMPGLMKEYSHNMNRINFGY